MTRNLKQDIHSCKNNNISSSCHTSGKGTDGVMCVLMAIMLMSVAHSLNRDKEMEVPLVQHPKGTEDLEEDEFSTPPPPTPELKTPEKEGERPKQRLNPPGSGFIATKKRRMKRKRQQERKKIEAMTEKVEVVADVMKTMALNEPPQTPKTSGALKRKRALDTGSTGGTKKQQTKKGDFRAAANKHLTVRATYNGTSGKALSAEDASGLRGALEASVAAHVGVALQFDRTVEANGLLHIYCGNEDTRNWTRDIKGEVLEGKFRVVETALLPLPIDGATRANVNMDWGNLQTGSEVALLPIRKAECA